MSFWQGIKQKTFATIRRVFSIGDADSWARLNDEETGERVTEKRVLGLSASWACVNILAGTIATLPIKVYREGEDGIDAEAPTHWSKRLLDESPNTDDTSVDFWEFIVASLELRGHAYARKFLNRKGTRVVALRPINADTVEEGKKNGVAGYYYHDKSGARKFLPKKEMFHIKGFLGLSTLSVARHVLGISIAVDKSAASTFKNGPKAWGILKFPKWLTGEQRKETREILQKEHAGASKTGKPLILEGGVDWQQMSFSPKDAQMLESRSFSIEEQCRFFGVPPVLIGHNEKTTSFGTGVGQILQAFEKFALRRRLKRIEKAIYKQILTPVDRGNGYKVKFVLAGLLRGDEKTRSEIYKTQLGSGVRTINEVRALEDLPPVEGGDVPRLQKQYVAITDVDELDGGNNSGGSDDD